MEKPVATLSLDSQLEYWDTEGTRKSFAHPLNLKRVSQWLSADSRILDFGCGYGRCLGELFNAGYRKLIGFDFSPAMICGGTRAFSRDHVSRASFLHHPVARLIRGRRSTIQRSNVHPN